LGDVLNRVTFSEDERRERTLRSAEAMTQATIWNSVPQAQETDGNVD
jgi:hypothetical protein